MTSENNKNIMTNQNNKDIKTLQVDTSFGSKVQAGLIFYNIILISIIMTGVSMFILKLNHKKNNTFVIVGNLLVYLPAYIFILTL